MSMKQSCLILISFLLVSCRVTLQPQSLSTPLPGWRDLVSVLLLDDDSLPDGWARIRDWPKGSLTDTTINHVYRSWWGKRQGYGKVEQHIWRSYTIEDARAFYLELRQDQFDPLRTPHPDQIYVPYNTPEEIKFQSQLAQEFYLACGWSAFPQCVAIARYKNYVVEIITDWETIGPDGKTRNGLTYKELEKILVEMDGKFSEFLATYSVPTQAP